MMPRVSRVRALALALAALVVALALAPRVLAPIAGARLRALAARRGLEARWAGLHVSLGGRAEVTGLTLVRPASDTAFTAARVAVAIRPWSLLLLHPAASRVEIADATLRLRGGGGEDDTSGLADEPPSRGGPAAPRVRAAAAQVARALLAPARELPALSFTDVRIERGDSSAVALDGLLLDHDRSGVQLALTGALEGESRVPFDAQLRWNHDDRLTGRAEFRIPDPGHDDAPLVVLVDGRASQDRRAGVFRIARDTRVTIGDVTLRVAGEARRAGPRFSASVAADRLTATRVEASVPRPVLGPLANLDVRGSWDWRARCDVDVSRPDSARFAADVIPHGLELEPGSAGLPLLALAGPFTATIHLPHDRIAVRELSPANPHFRTLEAIAPDLRNAVLTNEDGAFFRHRGFNTEAIQLAIAANLRAGAYKRGAGTITMQLARNLFLGHRRTLSRKAQEVVLAWVLEHLTGLPKERLLEIYLNVIEWGPGVHGADEAARFYFDRDAADLSLPEALFLTIVVPSPSRWRSRVDASGELRPYARAQMHFIAQKMAAKGWLDPGRVPAAESLRIELRGAARATLDSLAARSRSAGPA